MASSVDVGNPKKNPSILDFFENPKILTFLGTRINDSRLIPNDHLIRPSLIFSQSIKFLSKSRKSLQQSSLVPTFLFEQVFLSSSNTRVYVLDNHPQNNHGYHFISYRMDSAPPKLTPAQQADLVANTLRNEEFFRGLQMPKKLPWDTIPNLNRDFLRLCNMYNPFEEGLIYSYLFLSFAIFSSFLWFHFCFTCLY